MYRGDPGIFGSIWKGIKGVAGAAVKVGTGFLRGGPMGAIGAVLPGGAPAPPPMAAAMPAFQRYTGPMLTTGQYAPPPATVTQAMRRPPPAAVAAPQGVPGAAVAAPRYVDGQQIMVDNILVTQCPSGHRPNKSGYFWTNPASGQLIYQPPGTKCVKSRRRNPLNPRAADRAISRLESTKRAVKRFGRVSIRSKCACKKS
jgi:hypothetical protein